MMKKLVLIVMLFGAVNVANSQVLNDSTLMAELVKNDIKCPQIVLAQAKLETGNYKSKLCRVHGNLFGLNSRKGYRRYNHWTESVKAYKKLIQSRYKGGDYYDFLRYIKFAEDRKYIIKLKKLLKLMLDIDEKIQKFNPFYTRISEFNGYNNEITVKCNVCGETITYKTATTIAYKTVKCPECERRMKEQKFIEHLKLYRPEIKVLGKYINRSTKILVQCMKCGNIYEAIPNNLYTIPKGERHGCVKCLNLKRTNEDFLKDMKIIQPNIEFLSPYNGYFGKILCKCKLCQFEFQAAPDHLYRDTKCPNCLLKYKKRTELTYIEDLKEANPYIELIPGTYINTKNNATFKCLECGYTWNSNAGQVLWEKTGCPICSKSKGEKEIAKILTNKNIKFIPLYELSVNFTNRRTIYIDFYLPDYNLFIEYNGEQHYIPIKTFGGELTLTDLKLRDEQLRTYCKVNNIYLLEIPYTEYKNKTIQKTIEDKLIEYKKT